MISHPRPDQSVRLRYRKSRSRLFPLHGRTGVVTVAAKGPGPRNHGVLVGGRLVVVPAGQIVTNPEAPQ
jgi:hypothetical protein